MKMNNRIKIYLFVIIGVVLFTNCKKNDNNFELNPTNGKTTAVFNPTLTYGKLTDQDGNEYKTIKIGTQIWMAENLRTIHYRNGDTIPEAINNWQNLSTGAYCNYNNTRNIDEIATHGRLYNWYAISDSRNIAPNGWHIPTQEEWMTLLIFLGSDAGWKLKEMGTTHWTNSNSGAINASGFTAFPCGFREFDGRFEYISNFVFWWSSKEFEYDITRAWYLGLGSNDNEISWGYFDKTDGMSIRCIHD